MVNQEEIMRQITAAVDLHNKGALSQAEAIYRNVLAIEAENFHALRFLGCLCRAKGSFSEGISLLLRAVKIRPGDKDALYNLANLYMDSKDHENAVETFERCLVLESEFAEALVGLGWSLLEIGRLDDSCNALIKAVKINPALFQAWMNLGNTLKHMGRIPDAIRSYRKAIELKPDFAEAYLALGLLQNLEGKVTEATLCYYKAIEVRPNFADPYFALGLIMEQQRIYERAIACYRMVIELRPDFSGIYFSLGNALRKAGEIDSAIDAFAEHYRLNSIAKRISFPPNNTSDIKKVLPEVIVPASAEFIPSFVSDTIPFGMHLIYVHIPKAGGMRFSSPIFQCIQDTLFERRWKECDEMFAAVYHQRSIYAMTSHRIDSDSMRDGIVSSLSSYDVPKIDFSFLTPHGISSSELFLAMKDQFDVVPRRLAAWRDPLKRLRSALEYLYRTSEYNLDLVREKIDQKDSFLDNAIYRGCFSDFSSNMLPSEDQDKQIDYLIDIGDYSVMNQIMSSFLSRCRLPNIIVNKKVNTIPDVNKMDSSLSDSLMQQCMDAGFLSRDCSHEVEKIVSRKLPEEFDLRVNPSATSLHPLTFVVNASTDITTTLSCRCFPTEYLLSDQGQQYLWKTFTA